MMFYEIALVIFVTIYEKKKKETARFSPFPLKMNLNLSLSRFKFTRFFEILVKFVE